MITLEINGQDVEVDDGFANLSPQDQQSTVEEIAGSMNIATEEVPQGGSIADPLLQGASFGFADEIEGAGGAAFNAAKGFLTGDNTGNFRDNYKSIRDEARQRSKDYKARNPTASLLAEMAGGLVTGGVGAARVGALRGVQSVGRLAGIGAAEGGIYGAGSSEADTVGGVAADAAVGAGLGGLTAGGVGAALKGVARAVPRGTAPITLHQKAVDTLENAGVTLTTGQKTGSDAVKSLETTLSGTITGGALRKAHDRSREQFQGKLMEMAGFAEKDIKEGLITKEGLDRAGEKLSNEYKKRLNGKKIDLTNDTDFIDDLADVEQNHLKFLEADQSRDVNKVMSEILREAGDKPLSDERYQYLRSKMGERARKSALNKPELSSLYESIQDSLDDAFMRHTGENLRDLNTKYAQYVQVDKLYNSLGGQKVAAGELPLASLSRLSKNKKSRGSRQWEELIESGVVVFGDSLPNSGTTPRALDFGMAASLAGGPGAAIPAIGAPWLASQSLARGIGSNIPKTMQRAGNTLSAGAGAAAPAGVLAAPIAVPEGVEPAQKLLDGLL